MSDFVPFSSSPAPASVNADSMTNDQLHEALEAGYEDMKAGRVQDAHSAFEAFRETHS